MGVGQGGTVFSMYVWGWQVAIDCAFTEGSLFEPIPQNITGRCKMIKAALHNPVLNQ